MAEKYALAITLGQPFYHVTTHATLRVADNDHFFHCGRFSITADDGVDTLVLARFRLKVPRTNIEGHTASLSLNGSAYHGIPLTTVNLSACNAACVSPNNIFAIWSKAIPKYVTVHVDSVVRVPEDVLLRSLDEASPFVHNWAVTEAIVRKSFAANGDAVVESLQVSLICPLSRSKMVVPCRGTKCQHVQCFDAYAYLALNESTLHPSWRCPVCGASVLLEDMRVDLFMVRIVAVVGDDCSAVKIFPDVTWEVEAKEDHSIIIIEDSPTKEMARSRHNVSIVDLTVDTDDDC